MKIHSTKPTFNELKGKNIELKGFDELIPNFNVLEELYQENPLLLPTLYFYRDINGELHSLDVTSDSILYLLYSKLEQTESIVLKRSILSIKLNIVVFSNDLPMTMCTEETYASQKYQAFVLVSKSRRV